MSTISKSDSKGSFFSTIIAQFIRPEVSEGTIFPHNRKLNEVRPIAKLAKSIDNAKFTSQEFLLLVKIKYLLARDLEEYEGLHDSVRLLQVAIKSQEYFLKIEQTEIRYRGAKQQELYRFVEQQLANYEDQAAFSNQIKNKLAELLPEVKSEEGSKALKTYTEQLERLAEHALGLKLLSLFKAFQLSDYTVLKRIADILEVLQKQHNLDNLNDLVMVVISKYELFEKVGRIIGITGERNVPETYARMLQYIALSEKHELSFGQFEKLLGVLRKWNRSYQALLNIRQQYPVEEYKQPKDFSKEIPGEEIYQKYKDKLTDRKTGKTYADFGEEVALSNFSLEAELAALSVENPEQSTAVKYTPKSHLKGFLMLIGLLLAPIGIGAGTILWMESKKAQDLPSEGNPVNATQGNPGQSIKSITSPTESQSPGSTPSFIRPGSQDEADIQALQEQHERTKKQLQKAKTMLDSLNGK